MAGNLNICKYKCVRSCDDFGINARFNLLFEEVCALKQASSSYVLPIASASVLGGIKVGSGLSINAFTGVLSATSTASSNLQLVSIKSVDFESDGITYLNSDCLSDNTSIFWNDINAFIYRDQGHWDYVTGGIQILRPEFDANVNGYNLEIFIK